MGWAGGFSNQALPFIKRRGPCQVYVCFWEAGLLDGLRACMHAGGFERWNFFSSCCVDFATVAATVLEGALSSDGDLSRAGLGGCYYCL